MFLFVTIVEISVVFFPYFEPASHSATLRTLFPVNIELALN